VGEGALAMSMHVEWGKKKIPLSFDLYPEPSNGSDIFYEPEVINVFDHFVEAGDCVVDVGASVGFHTCFLSKLVGETGRVFAFEPHFKSFEYLMHHVHTNKLENVECLQTALWKEDSPSLELWSVSQLGYSSFHHYSSAETSEFVEGRALDALLINQPRVIKIDCEGTEVEVLRGAHETLVRGVDCVIMELNYHLMNITKRPDSIIREYMDGIGYDMFLINICDENGIYLAPCKIEPRKSITLLGGTHINVLFSTEEKVAQRWT
jgi:FkbM family methyltransferase